MHIYSARSASIGSNLLAFHAGYKPATTPITKANKNDSPRSSAETNVDIPIYNETRFETATPNKIPIIPPIIPMNVDS